MPLLGATPSCLDNRRHLGPDFVCARLDEMHEFLWRLSVLEIALQCVGHFLKGTLLGPELNESDAVCEYEVVYAQPLPLNDMNQLMKVEAFRCLILLQEDSVFECYPSERHLLYVRELRQAHTVDRREWNPWHYDHLGAL